MTFDAFISKQTARIKAVPVVFQAVPDEAPIRYTDRIEKPATKRKRAARAKAKRKVTTEGMDRAAMQRVYVQRYYRKTQAERVEYQRKYRLSRIAGGE